MISNTCYTIPAGPQEQDPLRHAVQAVIRVLRWETSTTFRTHRAGRLLYRTAGMPGVGGIGWDDSGVEGGNSEILGATKSSPGRRPGPRL